MIQAKFNMGGRHYCAPDWSWSVTDMADHDLWLVTGGTGQLDGGGRRYPLQRGDCFIVPPGGCLEARHDPADPLRVIAVHFDLLESDRAPAFHRRLPRPDTVEALAELALRTARRGQKAEADYWIGAALNVIAAADRAHVAEKEDAPPRAAAWRQPIENLAAALEASHGRLELRRAAAGLGLSYDHFGRLFRRFTGQSPEAFQIQVRLEQAAVLLLGSDYPVREIAEQLGYSSVYFFSRQFKSRHGVSPRHFRAAYRGGSRS